MLSADRVQIVNTAKALRVIIIAPPIAVGKKLVRVQRLFEPVNISVRVSRSLNLDII